MISQNAAGSAKYANTLSNIIFVNEW